MLWRERRNWDCDLEFDAETGAKHREKGSLMTTLKDILWLVLFGAGGDLLLLRNAASSSICILP